MRVTALELSNFRNYATLHFEPPSGVCLLVGANAQGKSNLLEALSVLAVGKSFRAARESDLIRDEAPLARVAARVRTRDAELSAGCLITRVGEGARKRFMRNGRAVTYAQFLGGIAAVTFMPSDLQLINGAPALRRRFLNAALSELDRGYYRQHARYSQLISQKNALLRSATPDRGLLQTYNAQIAEAGTPIACARARYVRRLEGEAAPLHARWVSDGSRLRISYRASPPLVQGDEAPAAVGAGLAQALETAAALELARRTSLVGPHRDDLEFDLGEKPLARFGSQGQQRSAVLAAKSAEYALLAQGAGESPLLLLDDVFSELDRIRQLAFMSSIAGCEQAFITSTEMPAVAAHSEMSVYEIRAGAIAHADAASAG